MGGIRVVVVLHLKGSLVVVVLNVLMSASEQQHSGTAVLRRAMTHTPVRGAPRPPSRQRGDASYVAWPGLYRSVLVCTGLHRPAPSATACTGFYWSVLACTVSSNTWCSVDGSSSPVTHHSMIKYNEFETYWYL